MNPWKCKRYKKIYPSSIKGGISLHFERGVDNALRRIFLDFTQWLRCSYTFPIHVNVYIKNCERVRLMDGRWAYGAFRYFDTYDPPYIRIPAKIEPELLERYPLSDNYELVLSSFVHELTHYFQWVNQLELTDRWIGMAG